MKKACMFLNGDYFETKIVPSDFADCSVIAVDGGANTLSKFGIIPHVVIGDMDSINPKVYSQLIKENIKLVIYPRDKDQTDSELALQYAIKNGYQNVEIYGMIGDRFDHVLSNMFHFGKCAKKMRITIVGKNQIVYFVNDQIVLKGMIGDTVSLIPFSSKVTGIVTKGLEYPLKNESLTLGSTRGVSNVFVQKRITIQLLEGVLVAIHTLKF